MSAALPTAFSRVTPAKRRRFICGIDPGVYTGLAVFDRREQKIVHLKETDFFGVERFLIRSVRLADLECFVEVPGLFFYKGNDNSEEAGRGQQRDRFMASCGANRREGQLLAETLRRAGISTTEIRPIPQKKWTEDEFQMITKIYTKTSPHERDAARIAIVYATKKL
jgi:hypothetical protein